MKTRADYVLNCIPMHLLAGIEHNFPKEYAAGFTAIPRGKLFKIGLQMKERFWEREGIYGGISWTLQDIQQIWYPAHGIHRKKGVMLARVHVRSGSRARNSRGCRRTSASSSRSRRARRFIPDTAATSKPA